MLGGAEPVVHYRRAAGVIALLIGVWPLACEAQLSVMPHAAVDVEHNSNIFDLSSHGAAPVGKNGPTFGDTTVEARAGFDGTYLLGQQTFFGIGEYRRFEYKNFTSLSHNEETLNAGLIWKLERLLDGKVDYLHEQRMVQFMDLAASTNLILETENRARATANLQLSPEWRLENAFKDRTLDSPRTDTPGLSLHEDSIHEALRYLGVANLAAGIDAEYLNGTYRHDPTALNPKYHQTTVALAATYILSGLTNFNGVLGYTRRDDATYNGGQSAVTGALGYKRNLTGKTSIDLELNRGVNSYVTTGGNELDTSAAVTLVWQATYKATVKLGYSYTDSKFSQSAVNGLGPRVDHFQAPNAEVDYLVLHWLSIRGYARYLSRSSTQGLYSFDGTIYGIEFLAKPPERKH
ncbi:MAG: hypothetical protein JWN43_2005 [Gammaproteobacteria bacterium]|nr:hypothetical protein [Gammaproteobacteria bacterium]